MRRQQVGLGRTLGAKAIGVGQPPTRYPNSLMRSLPREMLRRASAPSSSSSSTSPTFSSASYTRTVWGRGANRRSFSTVTGSTTRYAGRRLLLGLATGVLAPAMAWHLWQKLKVGAEGKASRANASDEASSVRSTTEHKPEEIDVEVYKYVIIGAGTCGYEALCEILRHEPDAKVLLVGAEDQKPYFRPPLSKELWQNHDPQVTSKLDFTSWDGKHLTVYYEDINAPNLKKLFGTKVVAIEADAKALLLDNDMIIHYDKCLIATGGTPRPLPSHLSKAGKAVTTYRTIDDFRQLEPLTREAKHVTIIGGGFLGSELASALGQKGHTTGLKVTHIFPEKGSMELVLPYYLSGYITDQLKSIGVDVRAGQHITDALKKDGKVVLTLNDGSSLETDHVVVCIGIEPSTELATTANLEIDPVNGGILVNSELEARRDLFAAGDVSSYYDVSLGVRRRVEHYDHAATSGRIAGQNMVGARRQYDHLSMFWSSLPEVEYQAVGLIDPQLRTVGIWSSQEESKPDEKLRGLVYYLKDDHVVGVILWNVDGVPEARALIKRGRRIAHPQELKNAIPL